jgi:hypothetical protein
MGPRAVLRGTSQSAKHPCLRPPVHSCIRHHPSAIRNPGPPAKARPTRQLLLSIYPSLTRFGFVLHNSLRHPPPAGRNWVRFARLLRVPAALVPPGSAGNWVRFARFAPPAEPGSHGNCLYPYTSVPPSLALFCAFTVRPIQIGFVLHISLPGPGHSPHEDGLCLYTPVLPSLALFCAFTVRPIQIGFVLHILPTAPAPGPEGPNSKHESRNPKQAPMTEIQRSQILALASHLPLQTRNSPEGKS